MPHRRDAQRPDDARLESTLGRLYHDGFISEAEFDAGVEYGRIALKYLESIGAPEPYGDGDELRSLSDEQCFRRKLIYAQACEMLKAAGRKCKAAVDKTAIYGEPSDLSDLKRGLCALMG